METYDTFDYVNERREALNEWARKIDDYINASENVPMLKRAT